MICISDGDEFSKMISDIKEKIIPMPELVLLDINMPKKNGFDLLVEVRKTYLLKHIPFIIIFTSSDAEEDKRKSKELNANAFLSKPTSPKDYIKFFKNI